MTSSIDDIVNIIICVIIYLTNFLNLTVMHRTHIAAAYILLGALIVPIGTIHANRIRLDMSETRGVENTRFERIAERLGERVERRFGIKLDDDVLVTAVKERNEIMKKTLTVRFFSVNESLPVHVAEWNITTQNYPLWVRFDANNNRATFTVDEDAIQSSLEAGEPKGMQRPQHAVMQNVRQDKRIVRGDTQGRPIAGYTFDVKETTKQIFDSLVKNGTQVIEMRVVFEQPRLYVITGSGTKILTRLSTGKSNYEHSPYGRVQNIQKALHERINGAYIRKDDVFSFNDALVGAGGWKNALVIVNGKDLVMEPGGGICQAATTAYRAAVLAGLPVIERKSHSLYVTYYKKYGVGIDATVYAKKQDMTFRNDTNDDIALLAHTEGNEAYIDVFGTPDGRTVHLDGPYFSANAPSDVLVNGRAVRPNEIAWKRAVSYENGASYTEIIVSQYQSVPKKLHLEYPENRGIAELNGTYAATGTSLPVMLSAAGELF